jgi:hypothetical protein
MRLSEFSWSENEKKKDSFFFVSEGDFQQQREEIFD